MWVDNFFWVISYSSEVIYAILWDYDGLMLDTAILLFSSGSIQVKISSVSEVLGREYQNDEKESEAPLFSPCWRIALDQKPGRFLFKKR